MATIVTIGMALGSAAAQADPVAGITVGEGSTVGSSPAFWSPTTGDAYALPDNALWNQASPGQPDPGLSLTPPSGGAQPMNSALTATPPIADGTTDPVDTSTAGPVASSFSSAPVGFADAGAGSSSANGGQVLTTDAAAAVLPNDPTASATPVQLIVTPPATTDGTGTSVTDGGGDPTPVSVPAPLTFLGGLGLLAWLAVSRSVRI